LLRTLQPCSEVAPLISESLDRPLGIVERMRMKLHLVVCAWCFRYLVQVTLIRKAVRLRDIDHPEYSLTPEARERICRTLISHEAAQEAHNSLH
jgi:putative zinc finger protein